MIDLIDTHCHIHEESYPDALKSIKEAKAKGVTQFICVGTDLEGSIKAVKFAKDHKDLGAFASIGIHPHETTDEKLEDSLSGDTWDKLEELAKEPEVVAIGEFGFDFFYHKEAEARSNQDKLARKHFELAKKHNKPVILHIRDAFEPFFELVKDFPAVPGVVHSFSDTPENLARILALPNNFHIGLNGIMTFSKSPEQLQSAKNVPLERLLLETDSPYLTPAPLRGTINGISNTRIIAEFLSDLRGENIEHFCQATTANAKRLFLI